MGPFTLDDWTSGSGRLLIDLDAITENYRTLNKQSGTAACGACIKANGYGLGMLKIAPALANEGCEDFFFSFTRGAVRLRAILPGIRIHIFTGLASAKPEDFVEHNLIPTLNSMEDIKQWSDFVIKTQTNHPVNIHIDTGMLRLGLTPADVDMIIADPGIMAAINVDIVMSHLACADDADHQLNAQQQAYFAKVCTVVGANRASLANSSGIFLGNQFHFDLVRPGAALYGINPTPGKPSPMRQVVRLQGKIMQIRSVDTPQSVGYGATHHISEPGRIATVGVGYADGYLRTLSDKATVYIGDIAVPVVGRISMDLITLDVTNVPEPLCRPGMAVDLIGPNHDVDALAAQAGTIGYEILTSLGNRYHRSYQGDYS
jgi:alanine racemase